MGKLTDRFYFVSMLPMDKKLEIYKWVKGYCLWESQNLVDTMEVVMDEKLKDVEDVLFYDPINYLEVYKDYSYGRY